ncbi:hypothetical protein GCM10009834_37440 [Streptomonospora arabica]|uniref:RanBP2-type domain-containing protein n=1 Tax=Streptomonospora halophila TaxID=427369 RepID=A0ABP9G5M3_9ACTN
MEQHTPARTDRRTPAWDCRLCTRANEPGREACGYCGNPEAANHTLPPLPPQPLPSPPHGRRRPLRRAPRVRPYIPALAPPGDG